MGMKDKLCCLEPGMMRPIVSRAERAEDLLPGGPLYQILADVFHGLPVHNIASEDRFARSSKHLRSSFGQFFNEVTAQPLAVGNSDRIATSGCVCVCHGVGFARACLVSVMARAIRFQVFARMWQCVALVKRHRCCV